MRFGRGRKMRSIRLHHWAHRSTTLCDRWFEPETEWHRSWKNEFPVELQEIRHQAETGEIHGSLGVLLAFQERRYPAASILMGRTDELWVKKKSTGTDEPALL